MQKYPEPSYLRIHLQAAGAEIRQQTLAQRISCVLLTEQIRKEHWEPQVEVTIKLHI